MAARTVFLLLLLPALPPATPDTPGPDCRLRWVPVPLPRGAGRCRTRDVTSLGACAGHCESRAGPAPRALLDAGGRPLLAEARCCTMEHVTRVQVTLRCPGGTRRLRTVSAGSCRCDMCRLGRY
ncbi:glycoprotein hormone alpha-2 [Hirundo rustica]|uniref:glycoprotein hormone alpha-2 n=1 Tax=Hirundo rustica TaxID=43150 RepID=UPI001A947B04|nr:glycoprotein hormone alpha-2 [Hirundo rustica]